MPWITPDLYAAFEAEATSAHRLFTGPDAWVERLGADVLISHKTDPARDAAVEGLQAWEAASGFRPRRVFARFLPLKNPERVAPVLLSGDAALPPEGEVSERGMRFGIDFSAGYSAGFFIDQRANRAFVRARAPRRLLNTFAYTCSFSVAAALAGAQTVSVDLSKKSLDRGRANFALNGLSTGGHRFFADDVMEVFPRLERRGERFDVIILDPPTFSRGNGGRLWRVEDHLEELVAAALAVADAGASILISTNCTRLDRRALERAGRFALKLARRGGDFHFEPPLPDFPSGEGAQTLWLDLR